MAKGEQKLQFDVLLNTDSEDGFTVIIPALPGCITEGRNYEEALANAREAISLYLAELDSTQKREIIDSGSASLLTKVEVPLAL